MSVHMIFVSFGSQEMMPDFPELEFLAAGSFLMNSGVLNYGDFSLILTFFIKLQIIARIPNHNTSDIL